MKKNEILLFEKLLDILGVQVMSKNLIFKFSKLKKFWKFVYFLSCEILEIFVILLFGKSKYLKFRKFQKIVIWSISRIHNFL